MKDRDLQYPITVPERPRVKYPTDRAMQDALARFRRMRPTVTAVYISMVRGEEGTIELHIETGDEDIPWRWDTGRSRWTAGAAQAGRLEELLTEHGIAVFRRRPW